MAYEGGRNSLGTEGDHPNKATIRLFQNAPLERLGVLNDDSSEVGRRHFAVVYRVWLPDWSAVRRLQKGDSSIKGIGWIDLSRDAIDIANSSIGRNFAFVDSIHPHTHHEGQVRNTQQLRLASDRVVVVAGKRSRSGKSETAGYLSQQLNCPLIKTGELVKELMSSPPLAEIGRRISVQSTPFHHCSRRN